MPDIYRVPLPFVLKEAALEAAILSCMDTSATGKDKKVILKGPYHGQLEGKLDDVGGRQAQIHAHLAEFHRTAAELVRLKAKMLMQTQQLYSLTVMDLAAQRLVFQHLADLEEVYQPATNSITNGKRKRAPGASKS